MMSALSAPRDVSAARRERVKWGWGIDVALALTILMSLNMLALTAAWPLLFKAKSTEALLAGGMQRYAVVEHFALTGDWRISDRGGQIDAAAGVQPPAGREPYETATTSAVVDGVIVMRGRYPAYYGETALITLRPAVPQSSEPPAVRWLCGRAAMPPAWQGPQPEAATNMPDAYLFAVCRAGRPG